VNKRLADKIAIVTGAGCVGPINREPTQTTSPDALRSTVPQILAEGIRIAKGSAPRGRVSLRGIAQSPLLAQQLGKFRFLPDAIRRPVPATFCMAWNLGVELPPGCRQADTLALRLNDEDRAAHRAFVATLGDKPIWNDFIPAG
jgi:hypothetical protein